MLALIQFWRYSQAFYLNLNAKLLYVRSLIQARTKWSQLVGWGEVSQQQTKRIQSSWKLLWWTHSESANVKVFWCLLQILLKLNSRDVRRFWGRNFPRILQASGDCEMIFNKILRVRLDWRTNPVLIKSCAVFNEPTFFIQLYDCPFPLAQIQSITSSCIRITFEIVRWTNFPSLASVVVAKSINNSCFS